MSRRITAGSEAGFQAALIRFARLLGWRVAHFRKARVGGRWMTPVAADGAGWPDLVLCRRGVLLFAELKHGRGRTTAEQDEWIGQLRAAGQTVYVWRETDWGEIERVLR
jgi:hypothetical protein